MARLSGLRLGAPVLCMLLVGDEAARLPQETYSSYSVAAAAELMEDDGVDRAEEAWQAENTPCRWHGIRRKCGDKHKCEWRPMPLDLPPPSSQSCRLKDEWMLQFGRARYFTLQAQLLAAKAKKFKECGGMKTRRGLSAARCRRRAMHMLRAIKFLAKSQEEALVRQVPPMERMWERMFLDDALGSLSKSIGPDGVKVAELQQKINVLNDAGPDNDPTGKMLETLRLLQMLLLGTEEEKQEARDKISEMPYDHA